MNLGIGKNLNNSLYDVCFEISNPINNLINMSDQIELIDNSSLKRIDINLDIVGFEYIANYLDLLISKLRINGVLNVSGTSLSALTRLHYTEEIETYEFNQYIFNTCGVYEPYFIKNLLSKKLKYISGNNDKIYYYLGFVRE